MTNSLRLLVVLGWLLRLYHYLRDPSVWHDEAALVVNVLRRDFGQLLGPLQWNEAAPPLFLWLERAAVLVLGDSTFVLRLAPLLAGCLAVMVFADTAARRLPPRGAFWAVLLVAVSDRLLWHSAEAKPYAVDVALSTLLLFGYERTSHWPLAHRLVGLLLVSPMAIFLSYPVCFLCGGLWLALAPQVWSTRRGVLPFMAWSAAFGGAFLLLYFGPIRVQRTGPMEGCWTTHFPNWSRPWVVPWWSLASTLDVLRYCFKPLGSALGGLMLVGMVVTWRRDRPWLILLTAPLALAWLASLIGGYPYGGSRLEVFALPGLALLIGAGIEPVRDWMLRRARPAYAAVCLPLLVLPAVWTAFHVVKPWPRADAAGASRYILAHKLPGEPVMVNHWEFAYYFRHQPDELMLDEPLPSRPRIWVAFTAQDDALRVQMVNELSKHGRISDRREFKFSTVVLLERAEPTLAQR